jgi:hypothetical protein
MTVCFKLLPPIDTLILILLLPCQQLLLRAVEAVTAERVVRVVPDAIGRLRSTSILPGTTGSRLRILARRLPPRELSRVGAMRVGRYWYLVRLKYFCLAFGFWLIIVRVSLHAVH